MREIKFRLYAHNWKKIMPWEILSNYKFNELGLMFPEPFYLMKYTGLKDKNVYKEIYEYDIIDFNGLIIGNLYENENLLEEKTNILVTRMGEKKWKDTESSLNQRGCKYAK